MIGDNTLDYLGYAMLLASSLVLVVSLSRRYRKIRRSKPELRIREILASKLRIDVEVSKRVDEFLKEKSSDLIREWKLVRMDDLLRIEKRLNRLEERIERLEKMISEIIEEKG